MYHFHHLRDRLLFWWVWSLSWGVGEEEPKGGLKRREVFNSGEVENFRGEEWAVELLEFGDWKELSDG